MVVAVEPDAAAEAEPHAAAVEPGVAAVAEHSAAV
eukprot:CAMPEP_0197663078 /NCGR_PEP_ID=MMETSP1338-20131121/56021_1 /TAXON_ID=43686 ORGANISM="Pelagodinium beii, Strain RCC1491" /NCGR_SAMPLE_ID=MMETSP1338 /ASSEMBLY_ACC=CAM_ASM_000754 /LENGTH=34 /DNA_ID= /DNA_START= /DNA_END= /DNA_ORIENTATION=